MIKTRVSSQSGLTHAVNAGMYFHKFGRVPQSRNRLRAHWKEIGVIAVKELVAEKVPITPENILMRAKALRLVGTKYI